MPAVSTVARIGLEIGLGLFYCNLFEWFAHRYILHGLGKKKNSIWKFHWHEHHKNARRNNNVDPIYQGSVFKWNGAGKEALALLVVAIIHLPLAPFFPFFALTGAYGIFNYYRVHKRAHLDPEWARKNVPWHMDHHLGHDQDANWCVTKPWADILFGTRKKCI